MVPFHWCGKCICSAPLSVSAPEINQRYSQTCASPQQCPWQCWAELGSAGDGWVELVLLRTQWMKLTAVTVTSIAGPSLLHVPALSHSQIHPWVNSDFLLSPLPAPILHRVWSLRNIPCQLQG